MTANELMQLQYYLAQGPIASLPGAKYAYAAQRNIDKIRTTLREAERNAPGLNLELEQEAAIAREELKKEYCTKDDAGKPIIEDGHYLGLESDEFEAAWDALAAKYQEVHDAREAFMASEIELEFYTVPVSEVPKDANTDMMAIIKVMVSE